MRLWDESKLGTSMTKAQKIILLIAATLIVYLILVQPDGSMGHANNVFDLRDPIRWDVISGIAVNAGVAFLIVKKRRPGGRE